MTDQTYPTTARPTSINDLSSWERQAERIASAPEMTTPEIAAWWGTTLAAAATTPGLFVEKDGTVTRPKTIDELKKILDDKQDTYDRGRALYIAWAESGEHPGDREWLAEDYARREGLSLPADAKEGKNA